MTTTITGLPNGTTPLDGTERVPMDQAGVTVDATTQDIADLSAEIQQLTCRNQTGSTIAKGTAVSFAGTLGASGILLIKKTIADGTDPGYVFLGIAKEQILNGETGEVATFGMILEVDTSAFSEGSILWCDPATPGGLTETEPEAPNLKLPIAVVVNSGGANGSLMVRSNIGNRLADLHDVQANGSKTDGDALRWDAAAGRWQPEALATVASTGALGDLGDVDLTTTPPADGEALVYDSATGDWVPGAAGGGGTPGGTTGQIQWNSAGSFAGIAGSAVGATGDITLSLNGAASTPPLKLTGTWFSGGTGTTTTPQLLIEPTGTTSTAWSTSGTGLGVNAASGFTGNLLDLQVGGASKASVDKDGVIASTQVGGNGGALVVGGTSVTACRSYYGQYGTRLYSNLQLAWGTTGSTNLNTLDTGLKRDSAAVVAVTNGGAGVGYLKTTPVAVSALPNAATVGAGTRGFVSDSTVAASGNFGATVTGGGSNNVPVFSDGTNWLIG